VFARGIAWADAAWPTAPETGGVLARLAGMVLQAEKRLLGCHPSAVRVATSKRHTAQALARAGVPVVPTFGPTDAMPPLPGRWVVKPDDGAGGDGVRLVASCHEAANLVADTSAGCVAQPWIAGEPASLSLLCDGQGVRVLSANRQVVRIEDGRPRLHGLVVNAIPVDAALVAIGEGVARAIPGLWGYVGVDFVMTGDGPVVLEVNPRLTTSYCGLRPALGLNVAGMVLALLDGHRTDPPPEARSAGVHEVVLDGAADA
jgi:predicted ATP-grasp superfamily ATP-dependent carboligase